jgi:hypothetical protein
MSGSDYGHMLSELSRGLDKMVLGLIIFVLVVVMFIGGLIWGGIALYRNYNVKIERVHPKSNIVYVTNYVTIPTE